MEYGCNLAGLNERILLTIMHFYRNQRSKSLSTKFRFLRTITVWTWISLALQLSMYTVLNNSIAKVMAPPTQQSQKPAATTLAAVLPDANPGNVQISYAKDYLAYTANGLFKVFNLKQNKVVFVKEPAPGSDKDMGVLNYQWLPDRNTLIYFFAKKNPHAVTAVMITPPETKHVSAKTEDPNAVNIKEKGAPVEPKVVKRYNNPQITELNTLEFPDSGNTTSPNDRYNITLNNFPAGGQILQITSSTLTNLIYVTVKTGGTEQLMEIDVMKNTRMLQRSGENISNIVASDRYGTLYIESKVGKAKHILTLDSGQRHLVSTNRNYYILGDRAGKLYVGEVNNNGRLVKIMTGNDRSDQSQAFKFSPMWEGDVPYKKERVLIGSEGQVIVYSSRNVYIVYGGQVKEQTFNGKENYVSGDGAELIQLTPEGSMTKVKLEPLGV